MKSQLTDFFKKNKQVKKKMNVKFQCSICREKILLFDLKLNKATTFIDGDCCHICFEPFHLTERPALNACHNVHIRDGKICLTCVNQLQKNALNDVYMKNDHLNVLRNSEFISYYDAFSMVLHEKRIRNVAPTGLDLIIELIWCIVGLFIFILELMINKGCIPAIVIVILTVVIFSSFYSFNVILIFQMYMLSFVILLAIGNTICIRPRQ